MDLQYNIKTEVNLKQFAALRKNCDGICAFQAENNKYYIKLWLMKYKSWVEDILKQSENPELLNSSPSSKK